RHQGGAVATFDTADCRRLDVDGDLPARHSDRCLARLATSWCVGPASNLSRLLRAAGRDRAEALVGRPVRLPRLSPSFQFLEGWFPILPTTPQFRKGLLKWTRKASPDWKKRPIAMNRTSSFLVRHAALVFALKTFAAAMLAYSVALWLDMPRPFWAM